MKYMKGLLPMSYSSIRVVSFVKTHKRGEGFHAQDWN